LDALSSFDRHFERGIVNKRLVAAATAAACMAGLTGGVVLQTNAFASSQEASGKTIHVIATIVEERFTNPDGTPVDLSKGFPQLGAQDVFHDTLATPGGQPAGDDGGVCTVTSLQQTSVNHNDHGNVQCLVTFALPGGEITVQQLSAPPPAPADLPVTGGTGIYRGAKGDCVVSFPAPGKADLVFHLSGGVEG
jgi:hypothetical protein